ncbi:MAG: hypothetical protein Q4Q00_12160 [Turicibacter sp.]|nr:hypothetical protein [Turicibacter sp.]
MFTLNGPINSNVNLLLKMGKGFMPYVVTSPKDELVACRETAWLGSFLNVSPVYDISGPDVIRLLNYISVNRDYSKLKIGSSRHAILCNEKGQMLGDGVIIRKEDNLYRTYWLAPVLAYYVDTLGMDVQGKWVFDEFFFQIDGPKSLEIMEKATQCDLHDLKFAQNKKVKIDGIDTTIHRLGMSGCLAYEMHGDMKDAERVYGVIVDAGKEFGIRRLGFGNYCRNHTQGGYPNQWIHYWYPLLSSGEDMAQYIKDCQFIMEEFKSYPFFGSASDDIENAFVTPFDVGWDYLINYDHDFIGKEALMRLRENPPKKVVTLEWNAEDVGKVFASQFVGTDVEPTDEIIAVGDGGEAQFVISKVMANEKMIGVASGRSRDYYHRKMISLAFIEKEYAVEGKELTVVWGTNPETSMEIRATVAKFPYYNEEYRNETFDVEKVPHTVFDK